MITAAQRRTIAGLLFDLYPALTPGMICAWVSVVAPVAPGRPESAAVASLTCSQADTLIDALRAAQARRRPSEAVA